MSLDPILLMGGSGAIGHHTARALHAAHPDVPLLIGGRDLAKAQRAAEQTPEASPIVLGYEWMAGATTVVDTEHRPGIRPSPRHPYQRAGR